MDALSPVEGFRIDQTLEGFEVLTSFETRNRYTVRSSAYDLLYSVVEDGSMPIVRMLLGGWRPIEASLQALTDAPDLRLESPFRLYFHQGTMTEPDGSPVGKVTRRFGLLQRCYEVRDDADGSTFELAGTLLRPWTFHVVHQGLRVGRVVKRWNGLFREASSDADRFEADFPGDWPSRRKLLLLCALLLLDFAHFDSRLRHLFDLTGLSRD